jgi:hypothetical protein
MTVKTLTVHDTVETGGENGLDVEKDDLCLKCGNTVDGAARRAKHETGHDIFFFDTLDTQTDLVTAHGVGDFVFGLTVEC